MTLATLVAFLGVATLAYVTPGPDWFVVMRNAATSRTAGWVSALGVQCGLLVHMTAAAVGVAALLVASATAFTALKILGAAYLVHLGVRALISSTGARAEAGKSGQKCGEASRLIQVWCQSFVANVLNPKAAIFFVAVLPQFVAPESAVAGQVIILGLADIALGLVFWTMFVVGVRGFQSLLGGKRARVVIDRVAGVALIGLGGVLLTAGRRAA